MKKFRVGIIGCGYASKLHINAINSLKNGTVEALCDIDEEALYEAAKRTNINLLFKDYKELVNHSSIDVVAILTQPHLHLEMATSALLANKHVFLEKPIALKLQDAYKLVELSRKVKARSMIGYNLRFHRHAARIKEIINKGAIGEVDFINGIIGTNYRFFEEGAIVDVGVHHYDIWHFLLDEKINSLVAFQSDDKQTASVIAEMNSGKIATTTFSLESGGEQHEIHVHGKKGRIGANLYKYDGVSSYFGRSFEGSLRNRVRGIFQSIITIPNAINFSHNYGIFLDSFRREWEYFLDCILEERKIEPDFEDGLQSLQVALAAAKSSKERKAIKVSDMI